jgi:hypothetical protein
MSAKTNWWDFDEEKDIYIGSNLFVTYYKEDKE